MKTVLPRCVLLLLLVGFSASAQTPAPTPPAPLWLKGNVHAHTLNSDGDSTPGAVAHWYRDHDYDFLVLSDHNYFTVVDELQREIDRENLTAARKPFLLIPGEEVSDELQEKPIHVNGIDTKTLVGARGGATKREVLQNDVDAIRAAGGVPSVNHPNFTWAIGAEDLGAVKGLRHFEIYNGYPNAQSFGGGGWPSLEQIWDVLLSKGARIFGVAVDDAHEFKEFGPRRSNPGRGWIVVRVAETTRGAVRTAFENGDFYSSTGVTLDDVQRKGTLVSVRIRPDAEAEGTRFTTEFIGLGGKILATSTELESKYSMRKKDRYVRVRVVSSRNEFAWTQAFFFED